MSSNELETRDRILAATWQLLEAGRRHDVRMADIAVAAGISRQAVYLHFPSRNELMVATTHYVDRVCNLTERMRPYQEAGAGIERLDAFIAFWGKYIPEIYQLAKVLLAAREQDEAVAAAWDDRMSAVRGECKNIIAALAEEGAMSSQWTQEEATDLLWTMLSIPTWEQLTVTCGWTMDRYVNSIQMLAKRTLLQGDQRI